MDRAFTFYCSGLVSDNEKDAWESFDYDLTLNLHWIKGFKYWRTVPTLIKVTTFDMGKIEYRVTARLFAVEGQIYNLIEATTEKPYPRTGTVEEVSLYVGETQIRYGVEGDVNAA